MNDAIPTFTPEETVTVRDRTMHIGGFPFTDNPPRDSGHVAGRKVRMGGKVYKIKQIERYMHALPYRFGERVGLTLEEVSP